MKGKTKKKVGQNKPHGGLKVYRLFKNLIKKQPVPSGKLDIKKGITLWESASNSTKNNFPQQLIQNVKESPIASAALDVWQEFTEGGGYVDPNAGTMKINDTEILNDLNTKLSTDITMLYGVAVLVKYSAEGLPLKFEHIPFESARLGDLDEAGNTDRVLYNPYFGIPDDYKQDDTVWYYSYDPSPDNVKQQMIDHREALEDDQNKEVTKPYPGQVFWWSLEQPLARIYPTPFYYSAINWFRIDAEIQSFHERNIKNNFLNSVIINVNGSPDEPAGDQDTDGNYHSTLGEEMDKQMSEFAEAKGSALINWFTSPEGKANIEAFPTNSHEGLFITLQDLVARNIAIGTKVPPVLIGILQAGKLGDTQEIINAIMLMQGRTLRLRKTLSRIYGKLFTGFANVKAINNWDLKSVSPVNLLPDWAIASLTVDEKRGYMEQNFNIELEQKEDSKKPTADASPEQLAAQASLKGSVGGVQGILAIQQGVTSGTTDRQSALNILQLIYGFTEDEANSLLGTVEEDPNLVPDITQE